MGMGMVVMKGNLGKDPKVKTTNHGFVVYLRIALNKNYRSGKKTGWFDFQVIGKLAEVVAERLSKGSKVLIRASIEIGTNGAGEEFIYYRAREIEFCDSKAS